MDKIMRSRLAENKQQLKNFTLKGAVVGFNRYTGLLFFLPVALVQIYSGEPLTPGGTYPLYGILMYAGWMSITIFSIAMQTLA